MNLLGLDFALNISKFHPFPLLKLSLCKNTMTNLSGTWLGFPRRTHSAAPRHLEPHDIAVMDVFTCLLPVSPLEYKGECLICPLLYPESLERPDT